MAQIPLDYANSIWYRESPSGIYSEKASYGGMTGIGHPKYATIAGTDDLYLIATGLHGKNPQWTTVLLLDSTAVLNANGGVWPGTPDELYNLFRARPDLAVAQVSDSAPWHRRVRGIPGGTKVTVVTGAEGILDPRRAPPPSQAMVARMMQLPTFCQSVASTAPVLMAARSSAALMKSALTPSAPRGLPLPTSRLRR